MTWPTSWGAVEPAPDAIQPGALAQSPEDVLAEVQALSELKLLVTVGVMLDVYRDSIDPAERSLYAAALELFHQLLPPPNVKGRTQ